MVKKWKVTKLGSRKLHICAKVSKMGSIIDNRIDYNGLGAQRGQRHIPSKNLAPPLGPEVNIHATNGNLNLLQDNKERGW